MASMFVSWASRGGRELELSPDIVLFHICMHRAAVIAAGAVARVSFIRSWPAKTRRAGGSGWRWQCPYPSDLCKHLALLPCVRSAQAVPRGCVRCSVFGHLSSNFGAWVFTARVFREPAAGCVRNSRSPSQLASEQSVWPMDHLPHIGALCHGVGWHRLESAASKVTK